MGAGPRTGGEARYIRLKSRGDPPRGGGAMTGESVLGARCCLGKAYSWKREGFPVHPRDSTRKSPIVELFVLWATRYKVKPITDYPPELSSVSPGGQPFFSFFFGLR